MANTWWERSKKKRLKKVPMPELRKKARESESKGKGKKGE
jgi:hypothetical protein